MLVVSLFFFLVFVFCMRVFVMQEENWSNEFLGQPPYGLHAVPSCPWFKAAFYCRNYV